MVRGRTIDRLRTVHAPDATAPRRVVRPRHRNGLGRRGEDVVDRLIVEGAAGHAHLGPVDDGKAHLRGMGMDLDRTAKPIVVGHGERLVAEIPFGGGAINETLTHFANRELPFGGRGPSGTGSYHGRYSFECFSHRKSIVEGATVIDPPLRYPPYAGKLQWLRKLSG